MNWLTVCSVTVWLTVVHAGCFEKTTGTQFCLISSLVRVGNIDRCWLGTFFGLSVFKRGGHPIQVYTYC